MQVTDPKHILDMVLDENINELGDVMFKIFEAHDMYVATGREDYNERAHFLRGCEQQIRFTINLIREFK